MMRNSILKLFWTDASFARGADGGYTSKFSDSSLPPHPFTSLCLVHAH